MNACIDCINYCWFGHKVSSRYRSFIMERKVIAQAKSMDCMYSLLYGCFKVCEVDGLYNVVWSLIFVSLSSLKKNKGIERAKPFDKST